MMSSAKENVNGKDKKEQPNPMEWVEIVDPQSQNIIYANPATGECSWDKPKTGTIKPRSSEGEWWELYDKKHNLPYYYNTISKKTVWVRPKSGLIIPLTKIQSVALNNRNSIDGKEKGKDDIALNRRSERRDTKLKLSSSTGTSPTQIKSFSLKSSSGPTSPRLVKEALKTALSNDSCTSLKKEIQNTKENTTKQRCNPNLTITLPENEEIRPESMFTPSSNNELSGIKAETPTKIRNSFYETATKSSAIVEIAKKNGISSPKLNLEAARQMSPMANNTLLPVNYASPASTIPPKSLPSDLKNDINKFQIDGFAKKFFSTHKKGLFRKKVPLEKLLIWTSDTINQPLMSLNKALFKDALRSFKYIQRIMGDRSKGKSNSDNADIQWLIERGLNEGEIRDEIYVQIVKQLTQNPSQRSIKLGWELIAVLVLCFPPSKNFENYFISFVKEGTCNSNEEIVTLAKHCLIKLERICKVGPKGKALSLPEIEQARKAAFHLSVFGESLQNIIDHQKEKYPDLKLPRVLPFLADSVLKLNGDSSEGIFRVPGDMEMVSELKLRIDKDQYDIEGITDCNVPASLLKLFLRDLEEPLIPAELYDVCLKCTTEDLKCIKIIQELPSQNRRVAKFVITFLQRFIDPEVVNKTKMNIQNLAMVFAPSFLRCPSENLTEVFANSKLEQEFLRLLLVHSKFDY